MSKSISEPKILFIESDYMDVPLFELWLQDKKNLSTATVHTYSSRLKQFLEKQPDLNDPTPYNDFIIEKSIKGSSGMVPFSALMRFLEFKVTDGNLRRQLTDKLIHPPTKDNSTKEHKYLSEKDLFSVVNNMSKSKWAVLALLQAITGARAGDLMRMKRGSIISEEYQGKPVMKLTIIGKRNKKNIVFIHDTIAQDVLMNFLTTYNSYTDYYFMNYFRRKGREKVLNDEFHMRKINYMDYLNDLKRALEKSGLNPKTFASHDFRRCFARRAWEKWMDLTVLQKLLGHSNVNTTVRYLQQSGMGNVDYQFEMQS